MGLFLERIRSVGKKINDSWVNLFGRGETRDKEGTSWWKEPNKAHSGAPCSGKMLETETAAQACYACQ